MKTSGKISIIHHKDLINKGRRTSGTIPSFVLFHHPESNSVQQSRLSHIYPSCRQPNKWFYCCFRYAVYEPFSHFWRICNNLFNMRNPVYDSTEAHLAAGIFLTSHPNIKMPSSFLLLQLLIAMLQNWRKFRYSWCFCLFRG